MPKTPARASTADNLLLLLALVPYVLDRGEVSVSDAAVHFGRSEKDIERAVELIACAGVPGENSAYSHLDLFDIDWDLYERERTITLWNTVALEGKPRFSAREASALLAGLQYLAAHPAYSSRSDLEEVMAKLRAGSGATAPVRIAVGAAAVAAHVTLLNDAIANRTSITTVYHNKRGESGERTLDPLLLESRDATWFLRAWCHERQALRTFRVDYMDNVCATTMAQADHGSRLDDISSELFDPSPTDVVVTVACPSRALPLIADYLPRGFSPPRDEDNTRVDIRFAHYGSLTQFVGAHPGLVRVLAPASAREAVRSFAESARARYREGSHTPVLH
jgi:proteasome accessory factor C